MIARVRLTPARFTPRTREAIAVVIYVQSRSLSTILKSCVPLIVEQEIGRPVAGVKIWNGIVILVQAQIVTIETEINIKQTVAIIIGDGGVCESSLRRTRELEGIALEQKLSLPLVQKKQGAAGADHQKIL